MSWDKAPKKKKLKTTHNGEKAGSERGHQVLPGPRCDNRVVST